MDVQHGERKGTPFEAARTGLLGQTVPAEVAMPKEAQAEGVKFDQGKARFDLMPPDALAGLAQILGYGAAKYDSRNWEKGMDWSRVFAAAQRHVWAFWTGEDLDPESGLPHIDHALCCLAFLSAYQKRNAGKDDRHALINSIKAA